MEEERQKVNVTIAGRRYTFHIKPQNESRFRESVGQIEEKVAFYASKYTTKDMQDILSIVLVEYVMSYIALEEKDDVKSIIDGMEALDRQLEEYINSGR